MKKIVPYLFLCLVFIYIEAKYCTPSIDMRDKNKYSYPNNHCFLPESKMPEMKLHSQKYCIIDEKTGRVLIGKNENERTPNASTTKLLTSLLLEPKLSETLTIGSNPLKAPEVALHMHQKERFYVKDLMYSLLLGSHNDTAIALAEHHSGSVDKFSNAMNQKVRSLKLKNTNFITPNGLDATNHYSSCYDLCLIMKEVLKYDDLISMMQTSSYQFSDIDKKHNYSVVNKNQFYQTYPGALGGKTGFTNKAGYCFVGAAKRYGITMISTVLQCGWPPNKGYKWNDTKELMDFVYQNYHKYKIKFDELKKCKLPISNSNKKLFTPAIPEEIELLISKYDELRINYHIKNKITAPISKSTPIGTITIHMNHQMIKKIPIYAGVDIKEKTFYDKFLNTLYKTN